jgi:hypothetical protein
MPPAQSIVPEEDVEMPAGHRLPKLFETHSEGDTHEDTLFG